MTREEAIEVYNGLINTKIKEAFEFFAPELAESEDERIRKELWEYFHELELSSDRDFSPSFTIDDILAYLEKQKEQKPMNNPKWNELTWQDINELEEIINHVHYEYRNGISAESFGKEVLEQFRNMKEDAEVDACEQKPSMIQWKGDNLKEVIDFTGKSPMFNKWFKSFEEYEEYVHSHGNIFKLFNEDGAHYEVPVGAWIVKTPDGCNVASKSVFRQKPAEWSEEDKQWLSEVYFAIDHSMYTEDERRELKKYAESIVIGGKDIPRDKYLWFKSLRPQPKEEWSEEDEDYMKDLMDYFGHNLPLEHTPHAVRDWLKSLPERFNLQPKQEWSEEDKKILNAIISVLKEINSQPLKRLEDWDGYIRFLESLRPSWKPSEEQMNAIDYVLRYDKTGEFRDALKSLYDQLYNMYKIV